MFGYNPNNGVHNLYNRDEGKEVFFDYNTEESNLGR